MLDDTNIDEDDGSDNFDVEKERTDVSITERRVGRRKKKTPIVEKSDEVEEIKPWSESVQEEDKERENEVKYGNYNIKTGETKKEEERKEEEPEPETGQAHQPIETKLKLADRWQSFLERYFIISDEGGKKVYPYFEQITQMRSAKSAVPNQNGTTIFYLNYEDLEISIHRDNTLAELSDLLINQFDDCIAAIKQAVHSVLVNIQPDYAVSIRDKILVVVHNTPHFYEISGLTNDDVDRVRRIEGTVTQFDNGKQIKILQNAWECENGHVTTTEGTYKPKTCKYLIQDTKGSDTCDARIVRERTDQQIRTDMCYIRIQQRQDRLREGRFDPPEIDIYYEGPEVVQKILSEIYPGQYVSVDGVVRILHLSQMDASTATIEIQGSSFVIMPESVLIEDDPDLDKEVKREIPPEEIYEHYKKLVRSIAPHLEGLEMEKQAIIAQLAGSDAKERKGGARFRGELNVLLVGSPSTGKTELLKFAAKIRPRSVYVIGRSASAVGLTAGIEHVEVMRGGQRVNTKRVSFGAYALAREAIVCLDEVEKRNKDDYEDLSHPMDDNQELNISKAGIYKRISASCGSLHAGNPTKNNGIYDKTKNFFDQINFASWLSSRYDLIFALTDVNSDAKRNGMWNYYSDSYATVRLEKDIPSSIHNIDKQQGSAYNASKQRQRIVLEESDDWYPWQYVRREMIYIRQNYHPKCIPGTPAWDMMQKFWNRYNQINLTPVLDPTMRMDSSTFVPALDKRKIAGIIRVSEAIARIFRSETVDPVHMDLTINLFKYSIASIIPDAPSGYANPELMRAQLSRTVTDYASKEIKKGVMERVRDYRQNLFKFTKWLDKMTWDGCIDCRATGKQKYLQDASAHYYSYQSCGSCNGTKGQYRRFRYQDLMRIAKDTGIVQTDIQNYFSWLLKAGAIKTAGNQQFVAAVDLKDKNIFQEAGSEIFQDEIGQRELQAYGTGSTPVGIKIPMDPRDRRSFEKAKMELDKVSDSDIY